MYYNGSLRISTIAGHSAKRKTGLPSRWQSGTWIGGGGLIAVARSIAIALLLRLRRAALVGGVVSHEDRVLKDQRSLERKLMGLCFGGRRDAGTVPQRPVCPSSRPEATRESSTVRHHSDLSPLVVAVSPWQSRCPPRKESLVIEYCTSYLS